MQAAGALMAISTSFIWFCPLGARWMVRFVGAANVR